MIIESKLLDGISIFTVSGRISLSEFVRHVEIWYPENPTRLMLYDFTEASFSQVSVPELKDFTSTAHKYSSLRGRDAKTAIVARKKDSNYYLVAAYSAHRQAVSPIEHAIFESYDEAIRWLRS